MDFTLLVLLVLAIPLAAIAALALGVTAKRRIGELALRVAMLEREVAALTRASAAGAPAASVQVSPAVQTEKPAPEASRPATAPAPARTTPAASVAPQDAAASAKAASREEKKSFEEMLGARWTVIVGGLALALGGLFLVRYSIEQGWLGPAARLTLGALFSAGLLAFGERLRRAEAARGRPRRAIDIPAVVTSAGAVSAFAVAYAAYALYGFVGPALAFPMLGLIAVLTLVASLLHGPILGALGLIGAFVVPLIVSSDAPNIWALVIYLLAPTAAAFAVARIRGWPGLAVAAGLAAFLWGAIALLAFPDGGALLAYVFALTGLVAALHSGGRAAPPQAARPVPIPNALIAAYGLIAAATPAVEAFSGAALTGAGALFATLLALAAWAPGLAPLAVVGGALAALAALSFDEAALSAVVEATSLPAPGETARAAGLGDFLLFSGALGAVFLAGGAFLQRTRAATPDWRAGLLAAAAVATPLALLAVAYWRVAALAPDLRFATVAVLLAGAFALLAEDGARREAAGRSGPSATAAFATGAAAALGLALAMAMREGGLTVALAFLAAALGFVATARPIKALGALAIVAAGIVAARIALDPRIVGDALSTTPVFNALLWGYGAPMAAFFAGSRFFAKAGQALPSQALEGLALFFALLLGFAQARHFAHDGALSASGGVNLVEAGLDATVAFGLAAVAGRLNLSRASPVLAAGALAAGGVGIAVALFALAFQANPLLTGAPVGEGLVFNDLLVGYMAPAVAAFAAARLPGEGRPAWARRALGATALVLALGFVTLLVRRAFAGPVLDLAEVTDPEWYAYSAVWLIFGLALLAIGVVRRSQTLRLGSGLVLVAVVTKVFLFDMAGLGGVWRALSFIGLGGVLVGIGLVYQRLLFPRPSVA